MIREDTSGRGTWSEGKEGRLGVRKSSLKIVVYNSLLQLFRFYHKLGSWGNGEENLGVHIWFKGEHILTRRGGEG